MTFLIIFCIFIVLGLISGIIAGLLGIGGGVIVVPALYFIFKSMGISQENLMQTAVATTLAITCFTALGSSYSHYKKRVVQASILKYIVLGLILGSICGSNVSLFLPSKSIRLLFGGLSLLLGFYLLFPEAPPLKIAKKPNGFLTFFGILIGSLSSLLGIGGGVFLVPTLLGFRVSMKHAVGNSSVGTLITALVGTISYLILFHKTVEEPYSLGVIYIPAVFSVGISSLFMAPVGCKLAHSLPENLTKRVFAVVLVLTALSMILQS